MSINNLPPKYNPEAVEGNGTNTGCSIICSTAYPTDANPTPSSSRHQTSPAFFTWGICSTTRYKTYWCAALASKARTLFGCRVPTMHPLPQRQRSSPNLLKKASKKRPYARAVLKARMGLDGNARRYHTQAVTPSRRIMRLGTHSIHYGCATLRGCHQSFR